MKYGLLGLMMIVILALAAGFGIGSCTSIPSTVVDKNGKIVQVQVENPHKDKVTQALEKNPNAAEVVPVKKDKPVVTTDALPVPKKPEAKTAEVPKEEAKPPTVAAPPAEVKKEPVKLSEEVKEKGWEVQVVKSEVVVVAPPVVETGRAPVITTAEIYWLQRLDDIQVMFIVVLVVFGIIGIIALLITMVHLFSSDKLDKNDFKYVKRFLATAIIFVVIAASGLVFVPTTEQAAAAYIIPKIANSDLVQEKLPAELKDIYAMCKKYLQHKLDTGAK